MSALSIASAAEMAVPFTQFLAAAVRPLIGFSIFAAILMLFKPLINGILRAAWLLITPRKSLEQRKAEKKFQGWLLLTRMARNYEYHQPNLAQELRVIAARDEC